MHTDDLMAAEEGLTNSFKIWHLSTIFGWVWKDCLKEGFFRTLMNVIVRSAKI